MRPVDSMITAFNNNNDDGATLSDYFNKGSMKNV